MQDVWASSWGNNLFMLAACECCDDVIAETAHLEGSIRTTLPEVRDHLHNGIRRMARALDIPVEIVAWPTVREADGLAMSSRNVRLTPEDRAAAVVLNQSLTEAEALVAAGTTVEALGDAIRVRTGESGNAALL